MKALNSNASPEKSSARRSFELPISQAPSRHSVDTTHGQALRPEFLQEVREQVLNAKTCPITLESGAELGKDRYVSLVDRDVVYSRHALKQYLEKDGLIRAASHQTPTFRSPLTRRDMMSDALALGVTQNLSTNLSKNLSGVLKKQILKTIVFTGITGVAPPAVGLYFGIKSIMDDGEPIFGAAMIGSSLIFGGALTFIGCLQIRSILQIRENQRTAAAAQDIEMGQMTPEASSSQA